MEINEEGLIEHFPTLLSIRCTEKILEQMKKNICKIKTQITEGTGFFCKIPFPNKENLLKVLITNNHIINKELFNSKIEISIYEKNEKIILDLSLSKRMKYPNPKFDITIIQILDNDNINDFLELDEQVIENIISNKNNNKDFEGKTIYTIQYPQEGLSVSYGILDRLDNAYDFLHKCSTYKGSSGSPIMGINNKIIGIHKGDLHIGNDNGREYNIGAFLNLAINEFIKTKDQMLLIAFNEKYKASIKADTEEIEMIKPEIPLESKGLSELTRIGFYNLKLLDLSQNRITNINCLENSRLENLEKLILKKNQIENIFVLTKVKFDKLKELELGDNKIKNIAPLKNSNFCELEKLNLFKNGIENINVLKEVNFRKLKELNFFNNSIKDIDSLGSNQIKFDELKILTLGKNSIQNIDSLENAKFKENLIEINLRNNKIEDISALDKYKSLKILRLGGNKISDINILSNFKDNLEEIYLGDNKNLKNVDVFINNKFDKLKELTLVRIGKEMDFKTCYSIKSKQPNGLHLHPDKTQNISNTQGK